MGKVRQVLINDHELIIPGRKKSIRRIMCPCVLSSGYECDMEVIWTRSFYNAKSSRPDSD